MDTIRIVITLDMETFEQLGDYASALVRDIEAGEIPGLVLSDLEADLEGLASGIVKTWLDNWREQQPQRPQRPTGDEPRWVVAA
jgi:hypothetical protein